MQLTNLDDFLNEPVVESVATPIRLDEGAVRKKLKEMLPPTPDFLSKDEQEVYPRVAENLSSLLPCLPDGNILFVKNLFVNPGRPNSTSGYLTNDTFSVQIQPFDFSAAWDKYQIGNLTIGISRIPNYCGAVIVQGFSDFNSPLREAILYQFLLNCYNVSSNNPVWKRPFVWNKPKFIIFDKDSNEDILMSLKKFSERVPLGINNNSGNACSQWVADETALINALSEAKTRYNNTYTDGSTNTTNNPVEGNFD